MSAPKPIQTQAQFAQPQTNQIAIKPGEIISLGDRIAWTNVVPRGSELDAVFYSTHPMEYDVLSYIMEKGDCIALCLYARVAFHKDLDRIMRHRFIGRDIELKRVIMHVLHDIELYEMRVSTWRRLLSYIVPIKVYRYYYSAKDRSITIHVIEFKGMRLKPRIVKEVKIND